MMVAVCSSVNAQQSSKKEVPPEERVKEIVDRIAKKVQMTKEQKDSVTLAFLGFIDDVQKYNAQGNEKLIDLLAKSRDDKVKKILREDQKFDNYLAVLADLKKQIEENQGQQFHQQRQQGGGQHNHMGGMQGGMPGGG
jgi:hypothetical protein